MTCSTIISCASKSTSTPAEAGSAPGPRPGGWRNPPVRAHLPAEGPWLYRASVRERRYAPAASLTPPGCLTFVATKTCAQPGVCEVWRSFVAARMPFHDPGRRRAADRASATRPAIWAYEGQMSAKRMIKVGYLSLTFIRHSCYPSAAGYISPQSSLPWAARHLGGWALSDTWRCSESGPAVRSGSGRLEAGKNRSMPGHPGGGARNRRHS